MELIAFASGKGGTGKTLLASCLGYALIRAGHRVLMIDADPATDGLSLFLLGPQGMGQIADFVEENTFTGVLSNYQNTRQIKVEPRKINRTGSNRDGDHGLTYEAIISGRGLYGDESTGRLVVPDLEQSSFRDAVGALFSNLRTAAQYDYIIVDTRGGFAFESTDVCALADSFILVTDPDITSFYQDRNLVKRISRAAQDVHSPTLLRSIIVNRATEGFNTDGPVNLDQIESSFRLQLELEFPVKLKDTHPVPADIEVLLSYKTQRIPYLAAPASLFSFATLYAFSSILRVVTAKWSETEVQRWNELVGFISEAVHNRNKQLLAEKESRESANRELVSLRQENQKQGQRISDLTRDIERIDSQYQREIARSEALFTTRPGEKSTKIGETLPGDRNKKLDRGYRLKNWFAWLSGVTAAVIAAVLIYYFTKPAPPPPTPAVTFQGIVIDGAKTTPLPNALVSLDTGGGTIYHDFTDEHGAYVFNIRGLNKSGSVTVSFNANGYQPFSRRISTLVDVNRFDAVLQPSPSPTPQRVTPAKPHQTLASPPH